MYQTMFFRGGIRDRKFTPALHGGEFVLLSTDDSRLEIIIEFT